MSDLIRWHWRVNAPMRYEFHLDHLYVPESDVFPYAEGHQLMLQWIDPHNYRQECRRNFITEKFRDTALRRVFWRVPVTDDLIVEVALAKPDRRLGDNENEDQTFRVSYIKAGDRWDVSRVNPARPGFSEIIAA